MRTPDNSALFKSLCELYEYNRRALENALKINNKVEADVYYNKISKLLVLIKDLHLLKSFCEKYSDRTYAILDQMIQPIK